MDSHQVRQLEEQVAWAITEVLKNHFPGHRESPRITHLMAKVASSRNRDGWVRGVRDDAPFREADQSMVFYGRPARLAPEAEDLIVRTVHQLLPPAFDGPRKP